MKQVPGPGEDGGRCRAIESRFGESEGAEHLGALEEHAQTLEAPGEEPPPAQPRYR